MAREVSQLLSPPQTEPRTSVITEAHRIRDEFFNTIGQERSFAQSAPKLHPHFTKCVSNRIDGID